MKLAFTGASGTGKTTIAEKLSSILEVPVNPVGSRYITKKMNLSSPYDVDAFGLRKEFQHRLLTEKSYWELDKASENQSYITDRTHLDNLIYSIMHGCVQTVDKQYIENAVKFTEFYTHIVFFPLDVFIKTDDDSARMNNIEYQKTYETLLKVFLDRFFPNRYYTLTSVNENDRVAEVLKYLNG